MFVCLKKGPFRALMSVRDEKTKKKYDNGPSVVLRLCLNDYVRFQFLVIILQLMVDGSYLHLDADWSFLFYLCVTREQGMFPEFD